MKRKLILLVAMVFAFVLSAWATHQRAAEITYTWIGGNTYEFTLTCYTFTPSPAGAQRDSLYIFFGDGSGGYIPRVVMQNLGDNYTLNVYKATHNYSASGTYVISMEDANRNYGVVNVPNSVMVPMFIETELVINPFLGYNNSAQLLNAPVDKGCVGKLYLHNPSAYDPDGDSLSYRLLPCKGMGGADIPGYTYPQASSTFDIDPVTGELHWENPVLQGEYNVAFIVEEWRGGVKIGSVIRDMQILISACDNDLPQIHCDDEYCIEAGQELRFTISATDPDNNKVTLTATGAPFEMADSPASMQPESPFALNPSFDFVWNTTCNHVRNTPYQVVVHAKDNDVPVSLTNVKTINVSVLGPKVQDLEASPHGNSVSLNWTAYACMNAEKLCIYRKSVCDNYDPEPCETGIRSGFQCIAEIADLNVTSFTDDNAGEGLSQGVEYCYRMVAVFHDGAQSVVSDAVCVMLKNDLPLMTHVSNDNADLTLGHVFVDWVKPTDIDPQYMPPFCYKLSRVFNGTSTVVYQGADTLFNDVSVDLTTANTLCYKVEMSDANQQVIGESASASAILLSGTGSNRVANLSWIETVAWSVDSTQVFKFVGNHFAKIASVTTMSFADFNVENGADYQYYVRTFGHYAVEGIAYPLVNYSAIISVTPSDDEPPTKPLLEVETDCEAVSNLLTWSGNNEEDLAGFQVYYAPSSQLGFSLLTKIDDPSANSYLHDGMESVLGCYFIKAFDENGNVSQPSDTICIDNEVCPVYELPNVFTPNGDAFNEVFEPKHAQLSVIESFKITIFNRWGNIVFHTTDPLIHWDGKNQNTKLECSTGTYFYVGELTYQGLMGVEQMHLQGSVTIVR